MLTDEHCQTLLTGAFAKTDLGNKYRTAQDGDGDDAMDEDDEEPSAAALALKKKTLSQHKVRTSLADRTLDSMFHVASQLPGGAPRTGSTSTAPSPKAKERHIPESVCYLRSIQELRKKVAGGAHKRELVACFAAQVHSGG